MRTNSRGRYQINSPNRVRKNLIIYLVGLLTFVSLVILLLDGGDSKAIGDLFRSASSGLAVILSCIVVYRQKLDGIFGRAYASLTIGIACWFVAEIIWTYQEIGMGIENPFPSVADIFWLIGYAPLIYYIFKTYKLFASPKLSNIIVATLAAGIFLGFYVHDSLSSTELSTYENTMIFLIGIAYPTGDVLFIIMATQVVLNSGKGQLTSIPWIFIGMLVTAVADSIFGYTSIAGISADKVWNPVYVAGYLLFGIGLLWHYKFFVFHDTKQIGDWQQRDR